MVSKTTARHEPIIAANDDTHVLREAACALADTTDDTATLVLHDGTSVEIPASVITAIRQVIEVMTDDRAVAITAVGKRLTSQQAARMLNVRDEYLEGLLESGDIPYRSAGTLRLIDLEDLLAYKRVRDAQTRDALRELTRLSQEMGFYQPGDTDPGIS